MFVDIYPFDAFPPPPPTPQYPSSTFLSLSHITSHRGPHISVRLENNQPDLTPRPVSLESPHCACRVGPRVGAGLGPGSPTQHVRARHRGCASGDIGLRGDDVRSRSDLGGRWVSPAQSRGNQSSPVQYHPVPSSSARALLFW